MVEVVSLMYIRWPMENALKKDKNSHCLMEKCLITNEKVQIFFRMDTVFKYTNKIYTTRDNLQTVTMSHQGLFPNVV